jgi:hypothetical protein
MNKSAQDMLDNIPSKYAWMRPFLTNVCNKYGDHWVVPYVAGRYVLLEMRNEAKEIDKKEFLIRLELKIKESAEKGDMPRRHK